MKQLLILLITILFGTPLLIGQNQNVVGTWKGEWSNHTGFYYTFILELREDKTGDISGEFIWKLIKSPRSDEQKKLGLTATEYVRGTYNSHSRKLNIKGVRKEDPNEIIGMDVYDLTLSKNGAVLEGKTENHGTWKGVFYGLRQLKKENKLKSKTELEGREIVTTEAFEIKGNEVKIQFWDDSQEDGDIISLNLNGEWILKNYVVKKAKGEIILDLLEGDNYLILHAENLGAIAPNTAALAIIEDEREIKSIVLNSDMGKSEAIKIKKE